jgi:hypothetical protein
MSTRTKDLLRKLQAGCKVRIPFRIELGYNNMKGIFVAL